MGGAHSKKEFERITSNTWHREASKATIRMHSGQWGLRGRIRKRIRIHSYRNHPDSDRANTMTGKNLLRCRLHFTRVTHHQAQRNHGQDWARRQDHHRKKLRRHIVTSPAEQSPICGNTIQTMVNMDSEVLPTANLIVYRPKHYPRLRTTISGPQCIVP
jgi:hypothetical protein